jgi:hypothetical protein
VIEDGHLKRRHLPATSSRSSTTCNVFSVLPAALNGIREAHTMLERPISFSGPSQLTLILSIVCTHLSAPMCLRRIWSVNAHNPSTSTRGSRLEIVLNCFGLTEAILGPWMLTLLALYDFEFQRRIGTDQHDSYKETQERLCRNLRHCSVSTLDRGVATLQVVVLVGQVSYHAPTPRQLQSLQ